MEKSLDEVIAGNRLLREASERGNRFRSLVKKKLKQAGLPEEGMPMCPEFDRILREAHSEVYGNPHSNG